MARSHARLLVTIWQDADFVALRPRAQWLYFLVLSQPDLSHCGVVPFRPTRWATLAKGPLDMDAAVTELVEAGFIVVDRKAEELWVRSFVKYDGIDRSPNMVKAMRAAIGQVFSATIRAAVEAVSDGLPEPAANPSGKGSPKGSPKGSTTTPAARSAGKGSRKGSGKGSRETAGKGVGERGRGVPPSRDPTDQGFSLASSQANDAEGEPGAFDLDDEPADAEIVPADTLPVAAHLVRPWSELTQKERRAAIWDALMFVCEIDTATITATARGAYNRAVSDLMAVGATPEDVFNRAAVYKITWAHVTLSPSALVKHWAECDRPQSRNGGAMHTRAVVATVFANEARAELDKERQ